MGKLPVGAVWPFPGCQGPSPARQSGRGLQPLPHRVLSPLPATCSGLTGARTWALGSELVTVVPSTPPLV